MARGHTWRGLFLFGEERRGGEGGGSAKRGGCEVSGLSVFIRTISSADGTKWKKKGMSSKKLAT